eukprot:g1695.t1
MAQPRTDLVIPQIPEGYARLNLLDTLPETKMGVPWMQKWISSDQRFGWQHFRDADAWNARPQQPPMESNKGKMINYPGSTYAAELDPAEKKLAPSSSAPQFPAKTNWKVNAYGSKLPCRQGGGISSWQPSHVETLWNFPAGSEKWNKNTEKSRILNPAPTKGVLQYRQKA